MSSTIFMPHLAAAARAVCLFVVPVVFAQAEEPVIDEIVVTGQFRAVAADELPASIAVVDAATIADTAVQHFEEITQLVPNLNWAGGASRPRYFQVRGIGERSQYEGAPNPSVGFLIDDIDFSALGGIATTFDVEQVEVLRGPQGTRYGANALAGLIYVRTREPTETFDANIEVTGGSDDTRAAGLAFGGPVNESLSYRAVIQQYQSDGFRDNPFLGRDDTNGRDETSARLKLRYAPGNGWQTDLTAMYANLDNGYDAFAIDNGFTTYSNRPGQDAQETLAGIVKVTGDLTPSIGLTSLTSVARSDVTFSFDADWGNDAFWSPVIYDFFSSTRRDRQSLNQELRLMSLPGAGAFDGRVSWVAGVNVLNIVESNITRDDGDFEGFAFESFIGREYEATSTAVFGDVDIALSDRLSANAGLRVERRTADYVDSAGDAFDPDETNVGGQVALVFRNSDRLSTFARLARGYKAGGFNLGLPEDAGNNELLFDGEFLWNLEVGANASLLDNALSVAATAFWMERDDQQVQTSAQLDPNNPATFVFFTDNAGEGRNIGLEVSADYRPTSALSLYGALGLLDTRIDEFGTNDALNGRDQAHAPDWSYSLGGRFDFAEHWFVRLDVSGKDAFFFSDSHDQQSEAYHLVNARVGIERDNWSVFLWGRNLFDEEYAVRGFFFGNEPARDFADTLYVRRGDPRQYGVSFRYAYAGT